MGAVLLTLDACSGSSDRPEYKQASEVYAALVSQLEREPKVLHAVVTSTQSDNPTPATAEFWVDEANDVAREDKELTALQHKKIIIHDGQKWFFVGLNAPNHAAAPNCEGVTAPATSLLLNCQEVGGAHSELSTSDSGKVKIVTTGSYGPDMENKPWTIALTLDANSLMPLSLESELWAVLNNEPYAVHESWTYTTELVDRRGLLADLFTLK
jgi:hypothetical protein